MKLLCFSDLHCDIAAAERLLEMADEADAVIGAGDFAIRRKRLADTLNVLSDIDKPSVIVPGNGESIEELREAADEAGWESARVLHGQGCQIDGVDFWGVGGGIPVTPFGDWSYDFDEQQGEQLLRGCPEAAVLVVHSPPLDTVDRDRSGKIRGSQAVRDTVLAKRPKLVICGHIHDDWEKQVELNSSRVVNAGPRGVWLEV